MALIPPKDPLNPDYDYELRYPPYPSYKEDEMRRVMKALELDQRVIQSLPQMGKPQPQPTRPTKKLEEFTTLVIPGWELDSGSFGKSLEIRIGKDHTEVSIMIGSAKLEVSKETLQQLVAKLHEEFQMEKLGK